MFRSISPNRTTWSLCSALFGLVLALTMAGATVSAHPAGVQPPPARITLKGQLVPALQHLKPVGATPSAAALQLSISLQPRNSTQLQTLLVQLDDPTSANYHHYLTPTEYTQSFGRTSSEIQQIESYLTSQGIHVTAVAPNNLLIDATSSVATAEQAFDISIANYSFHGRTVYAPTDEPSLPAAIGGMVLGIEGLDNVGVWQSHDVVGGLATNQKQHPNIGGTGPGGYFAPTDVRTAYDMNPLVSSDSGAGSNLAIFELDGYVLSDIQAYRGYFGLPSLSYTNILVDGATSTAGMNAVEVTLDMEVASAIAPNATQEIYIGPNTTSGVNDTYTKIATDDTAKVVSTSWGLCEIYEGSSEASALDGIYQEYAAQGQALFAAAGDTGAYDCTRDGDSTDLSVDSPGSDPYVVSVGGTTLNVGSGESYSSETVWNNSTGAGGGGQSEFWTMPTYQRGPNVVNDYTYSDGNASREVPDVTGDADPNTGWAIFCSATLADCASGGAWYAVGGTSAAAPLWASIAIDTNQYLQGLSDSTLGSASADIYQIFNHPQPYDAYHDITSGNNLYYPAETDYDMASGVGSPDVWNFARDAASAAPTTLSKTWYFAEGYTGGKFTTYLTLANPNLATATVTVTYLLGSGSPIVATYTVNPVSRQTIDVNGVVGANENVSMVVSSNIGIVAERPMYFTFGGDGLNIPGGSDVLGATQLNTQFDFGYLDTTTNHATYLTVLNQNSTAMTVAVSYYPQAGGSPTVVDHTVGGNSRGTIFVNSDVSAGIYSAQVSLSESGLVERPMYLVDSTSGYTGSADVIGVQNPSESWYFAEGFTSTNFYERYILSNPNSATAHATVTYLLSGGSTVTDNVTINPGALVIVNANSDLGSSGVNNSATVTADQPIVAERFMSFTYHGPVGVSTPSSSIPGATDVIGATQAGYWFGFAEGYSGGSFGEYLTLENPDPTNTAYVGITYLPASGAAPTTQVISIAPHSRYTLYTNNVMVGQSFSMIVESGLPIVAERPMYFVFSGTQTGGTDVVGYQLT